MTMTMTGWIGGSVARKENGDGSEESSEFREDTYGDACLEPTSFTKSAADADTARRATKQVPIESGKGP
jgi:hypothetical protein